MKYVLAALFMMILIVTSVFQVSSLSTGVDKPGSWASSAGSSSMEKKLLNSLQALNDAKQTAAEFEAENDALSTGMVNNSSLNISSLDNSSSLNLSAPDNSSAINASLLNASLSSKDASSSDTSTFSLYGNSSADPTGVSADTTGRIKGFWGMQASQQGFGKSGINSKTVLSGDFNVDKTVTFQDRSF